ncbi:syntaxin-22-like [Rutidosis leptorrhynchoides]|uniref:syntaxin-22-like n=1 Tax=Rutidosis leptorrhynchoides TaxID=125765 RepID=UPI003A99BD15
MSFQDVQGFGSSSSASVLKTKSSPSQEVAAGIFKINTAVSAFRRLVDAVGTAKDTPDHRQKLHNTRQRILQLVKETSAKLKALSESDHQSNVNPNKKVEDAKLARDFQATLQEFQNAQQLSSQRESTYSPVLPPQTIPESGGEQSEPTMEEEKKPLVMEQRLEILLLDNEISFNEAMIEEREHGIREIEQQIGEANEIFKDLAVLVHEQGVTIDDIHSNIDNSAAATSQAKVMLAKANKSTKIKSSWCWWGLAAVVIVVIIIVLAVVL